MSEEDRILLSASTNAEAGTVEGSAFNVRRIGDQIHKRNITKEMRRLTSEGDMRSNVFRKQFVYYVMNSAFIDVLSIIVLYSFSPRPFVTFLNRRVPGRNCTHCPI